MTFATISFLIGFSLEICLFVSLLRRRQYAEYPFFCSYVAFSLVASPVVFMTFNTPLFFNVYWASEVIYKVLSTATLYEVFRHVFRAFNVYRWFRLLFPVVITIVLLMAAWYGVKYPPPRHSTIVILILNMEIGINLIQTAIFVLFFGLVSFFEMKWQGYSRAIVEGFAIIAVSGLLYLLSSERPSVFNGIVYYAAPVSYIVAVGFWLNAFRHPPGPEPAWSIPVNREQMLVEVKRYISALKKIRGIPK
jgi:hypothetical protein